VALPGHATRERTTTHVGEAMQGLSIDAQRAMQFPRSTPGVTTTLVGMKSVAHVEQNPAVAAIPSGVFGAVAETFL